jgi:hypothetical protein
MSERAMNLNAKRPYFLADIEPTIAVAEAARWERDNDNDVPPRPVLVVADKLTEARHMRSAYQRELMRRFASMIGGWFFSAWAPNATAKVRGDTRR